MDPITDLDAARAAVSAACAVVDAVRQAEFWKLNGLELLELCREVEQLNRLVFSTQVGLAGELDTQDVATAHGSTSTAALLRETLTISASDARNRVNTARAALPRDGLSGGELPPVLPLLGAALAGGEIGVEQTRTIVASMSKLGPNVDPVTRESCEKYLVEYGRVIEPKPFADFAQAVVATCTPDGEPDSDDDRAQKVELTLGVRNPATGMTRFHGLLDDLGVEILSQAIDGLAAPRPATIDTDTDTGTAESGTAESGTAAAGTAESGTAAAGTAESGTAAAGTGESGTAAAGTGESGAAAPGASSDTAGRGDSASGKAAAGKAAGGSGIGESGSAGTGSTGQCAGGHVGTGDGGFDVSGANGRGDGDGHAAAAGTNGGCSDDRGGCASGSGAGDVGDAGPGKKAAGRSGATKIRDRRSAAQRRGQALIEALRRLLDLGVAPIHGGERPHVTVTIGLDELTRKVGVGYLDFGGAIDSGTARMLACDALIIPAVLGSASQVLDVGTAKRLFPQPIRRAIELRDKGCSFPGCDRPPAWCDCHHVVFWADHGPSSYANGTLLCPHHHAVVHREHWKIRFAADGVPEFIPPPWVDPKQRPRRNHSHHVPTLFRR